MADESSMALVAVAEHDRIAEFTSHLAVIADGRCCNTIAEDLRLSLKTVQAYCARAKEKFGVHSLGELLRAAIRWEDATHVK